MRKDEKMPEGGAEPKDPWIEEGAADPWTRGRENAPPPQHYSGPPPLDSWRSYHGALPSTTAGDAHNPQTQSWAWNGAQPSSPARPTGCWHQGAWYPDFAGWDESSRDYGQPVDSSFSVYEGRASHEPAASLPGTGKGQTGQKGLKGPAILRSSNE